MPKTYIVANWKANKTVKEAKAWIDQVRPILPKLSSKLEVVLCAPFIHLSSLSHLANLRLGVQNLSPYPDGAYTGEISARMLEGLVDYCLLGHSERRRYFAEKSQQVALKATQALEHHLTPIIAVSRNNWHSQLNFLSSKEKSKSIFMYEPPEAISKMTGAIGTGEAAPIEEVTSEIKKIKKSAPQSPVLYGGSIKSHNLAEFLNQSIIDGVVPGSASLNSQEWLKILAIAQKIRG